MNNYSCLRFAVTILCCLCSAYSLFAQSPLDKFLSGTPVKTIIGNATINGLYHPVDLDFCRVKGREHELWVLNRDRSDGSSMSIFYHAGTPEMTFEKRKDSHRGHFMINCSALAMGDTGHFVTTQEVLNTLGNQTSTFMGPTLWTSDTTVFARINQNDWVNGEPLGSHLDMLHQSPYAMGVAFEKDNIYWVFDGHNKNLCRYDFEMPHPIGGDDHSDGIIWRYTEVALVRKANLPAHMVIDSKTGWLYIVDNSKKRVIRVDINSGEKSTTLSSPNEELAEYRRMKNVKWEVYIDTGLVSPCGIDVLDNRLIVSDNSNGQIIIYNIDGPQGVEMGRINTGNAGIMGIKIGPDSNIWYVNYTRNETIRLTPGTLRVENSLTDGTWLSIYPNPVSTQAHIKYNLTSVVPINLSLYNALGVKVSMLYEGNTQSEDIPFNVSNLVSGVYYVQLQTPGGKLNRRFVILPK